MGTARFFVFWEIGKDNFDMNEFSDTL